MSYFITGSNLLTHYVTTSGTTPNNVTPDVQKRAVVIASIEATETGGLTPNLTIDIYDPKTPATYYKRNQFAMTARQTVAYEEPFWLPNGWQLRVTTSTGVLSVLVNYFNPNATGQG